MTKKNRTCPNFSGFSAIMPIPAAPIPCWALPVPISPPAMAIAAAIASSGLVNEALLDGAEGAAEASEELNKTKIPIVKAAAILIADNFHLLICMSNMV